MLTIRPLTALTLADLQRVAPGYVSAGVYQVTHTEGEALATFELRLVACAEPVRKTFHHDEATVQRYQQLLGAGDSFGAYDGETLVGLLIAEVHHWNHSLWVWEFHVAERYRRQGLGRRLMECAVARAQTHSLRIIVCETQNTNTPAIRAYRQLGFRVEGVDISYYTNQDYPAGEMAVFMKRRVG